MKLFKTTKGIFLESNSRNYLLREEWDTLINRDNLYDYLSRQINHEKSLDDSQCLIMIENFIHAPICNQEIWAAGVTYLRSRDARMEESQDSGGADFYSKVYHAERPELFFKASPNYVAGNKEKVFIRRDSKWNVPEPELTLFINSNGKIQGYTIGNDMSSRDIEGENPLYLPQAKVYNRSAALGPCLYVPEQPLSPETNISIVIKRNGSPIFKNEIQLNKMKRNFTELAEYLFRECDFENGVFLMTGTGIVPPNDFTLQVNDEVEISIDNIGTLTNIVAYKNS
ncbi:MAG TPA: fumarylacetoacetate hydrolase family protein [Chitinophagaceae bacterium]|nr:fumarylacetoacetate hydrolase family protein [Chitinophagaceae bacterium]